MAWSWPLPINLRIVPCGRPVSAAASRTEMRRAFVFELRVAFIDFPARARRGVSARVSGTSRDGLLARSIATLKHVGTAAIRPDSLDDTGQPVFCQLFFVCTNSRTFTAMRIAPSRFLPEHGSKTPADGPQVGQSRTHRRRRSVPNRIAIQFSWLYGADNVARRCGSTTCSLSQGSPGDFG